MAVSCCEGNADESFWRLQVLERGDVSGHTQLPCCESLIGVFDESAGTGNVHQMRYMSLHRSSRIKLTFIHARHTIQIQT